MSQSYRKTNSSRLHIMPRIYLKSLDRSLNTTVSSLNKTNFKTHPVTTKKPTSSLFKGKAPIPPVRSETKTVSPVPRAISVEKTIFSWNIRKNDKKPEVESPEAYKARIIAKWCSKRNITPLIDACK